MSKVLVAPSTVVEGDPADELVASVFTRNCLSRSAMADVVGKWAVLTLVALREGDYRFNALRRRVDGVSEKMLSQTLQTLERDGMVTRAVLSTIPPRVEYSITPLGAEVADRLGQLIDLLEGTVDQVADARRVYDARQA
jgi:DNA-binding HxlR family transcriptional regulator